MERGRVKTVRLKEKTVCALRFLELTQSPAHTNINVVVANEYAHSSSNDGQN